MVKHAKGQDVGSGSIPCSESAGFSFLERFALFAAAVACHGFLWRALVTRSCCDAYDYLALGQAVVKNGLFHFSAFSTMRTYGYPLVVGVVGRTGDFLGIAPVVAIFEFQLVLFLVSAAVFRKAIAGFSAPIARIAFVATCLNLFVLPYTAEVLTESVSLSIILLVASCWLAVVRGFQERHVTKAVLAGSLLSGFAVMIRPANVFLLAT